LNYYDAATINKDETSVQSFGMHRVMSQYRFSSMNSQPRSFVGQAIAFVVGLAVLAASFVLGAFLLAALFGFIMIAGFIVTLWMWWLRRKAAHAYRDDHVLDGEYTVVEDPDHAESIEHRRNR
jgi:fatty acid desaturase